MEKLELAETEDKKLERLRESYKKAHDALMKSKRNVVWHLAELSDAEKQVLEKGERGEPLEGFEERGGLARARKKIEDVKMNYKDILDLPDTV